MFVFAKGLGTFLALCALTLLFGFRGKEFVYTLPVLVIVTVLLTIVFTTEGLSPSGEKEPNEKPPRRAG
ncbi:MAG: hypothetical protein AAB215_04880 [Planctomycetota bacterium]